jgi:aminoglycoside phosphotransferase (APT) family kinase protein
MIVDRGAVQAALELWNSGRRGTFYPKTDRHGNADALKDPKIDLTFIAQALDAKVQSIEPIKGGTMHQLHRIKTPNKNWILKLPYEDADFGFELESRAMDQLSQIGLPALKVPAFSAITQAGRSPFLLVEEAPGRTLTSFEDPESQQMPEQLLVDLGRTLAQVHQVPGSRAGLVDCSKQNWNGLVGDWNTYLSLHLDNHLHTCAYIGAIDARERNKIESLFIPGLQGPSRLLHGDPGHHNMFSDGERITAIIDWEDALIGDPIFDIAYWGTFVRDAMRTPFLSGYQTIEKLPFDFEYRYWLYYLRIAVSKTVHRHQSMIQDREGRPPASQRIQKALSNLAKI